MENNRSREDIQMKIGEIRDLLQAAEDQMLPDFIARFEKDERSGVQQLVQRARKRLDALEKERERLMAMHQYEEQYKDCQAICGIDEAGRGPLAGPVVAAAVILPKDCEILYLNDSKQLSAKKRELLYDEIMEKAVSVGVGYATPQRIDEINILQATYEAMRQAVNKLSVCPDILLNDAVRIPGLFLQQVPIVKGDAKSVSIAAASIIAKVTRDRLMMEYDKAMPQYHFAANKGYGSAEHIEALAVYGASPIHRRSFITHFKVKE
jgi:ribonuclease HII